MSRTRRRITLPSPSRMYSTVASAARRQWGQTSISVSKRGIGSSSPRGVIEASQITRPRGAIGVSIRRESGPWYCPTRRKSDLDTTKTRSPSHRGEGLAAPRVIRSAKRAARGGVLRTRPGRGSPSRPDRRRTPHGTAVPACDQPTPGACPGRGATAVNVLANTVRTHMMPTRGRHVMSGAPNRSKQLS